MFLVNSRLGLFSATPSRSAAQGRHAAGAPLLPKLRGQFAEFLNEGSLVHLGTSRPAHLCRFAVRAARVSSLAGFSWQRRAHSHFGLAVSRRLATRLSVISPGICPRSSPTSLDGHRPIAATYPTRVPPLLKRSTSWYRNINRCPSATPRGLGLGPTNPTRMNLAAEPSGIRWWRFSPPLALLMPAFALVAAPRRLPLPLHRRRRRSPTMRDQSDASAASAAWLEPR